MATGLHINRQKDHHVGLWIFTTIILLVLAVVGWYAFRFYTTGEKPPFPIPVAVADPSIEENDVTEAQLKTHKVDPLQPRYISIPSQSVLGARIFGITTRNDGELGLPHNIHDAGWFNKSATPGGQTGAVLIDGRSNGPTEGGIFQDADRLKSGDKIMIERGDGKQFTYIVKDVEILGLKDLSEGAMKDMAKSVDKTKEGLNLVVSTGNWIPAQEIYDQRVAVRAVRQD